MFFHQLTLASIAITTSHFPDFLRAGKLLMYKNYICRNRSDVGCIAEAKCI